mmetsp:Transcript_23429/g.35636  ORF Transcript_23429/g.35636 Transcript_23429/m.35636 type:complete len:92 (-) Transcript_23429:320-595(-)
MNAVTLDFFDAHHRVGGPVNPPGPTGPPVAKPTDAPITSKPTSLATPSPTKQPAGVCTARFVVPPPGSDCYAACCNRNGCWTKGSKNGQCK